MSELEGRPAVKLKLLGRYAIVVALISVFSLAGPAEAVDFTATTSLGIRVSSQHIRQGHVVAIRGRLKSGQHSCVNDEKIKLFAKPKGKPWKQVAHTRTAQNGTYVFVRHPKRTTRFETKYSGKTTGVHPNEHTCLPSHSVVKKVRVT
jgi:hypothetical protein